MRRYDEEEIRFLRDHIPGRSYADTAAMFNAWNAHYPDVEDRIPGPPITAEQVKSFAGNYGVRNGRDTKFKKGQTSHNKGKYVRYSPATEFKKGQMPRNHRPVGSTRINVDGYTEIKVAEPKKWRMLHVVTWEQAYGPVPKGHIIIFGDGNRQNIMLENLIPVTRAQLVRLNQQKLIGASVELTKTGIVVADLLNKIGSKKKLKQKRKNKKGVTHG